MILTTEAAARYAAPKSRLAYGTAGFRANAALLDSTFYRMGMLAALRSRAASAKPAAATCKRPLAVGLMVTASHNPEADNGIKLVDVDGGMLSQAFEPRATAVANASSAELPALLGAIAAEEGGAGSGGVVLVARDTHSHSARFATIALEGAAVAGAEVVDLGLLTTPQLHHMVRFRNGEAGGSGRFVGDASWATEDGYYDMLSGAFLKLLGGRTCAPLWVDCAHGIGAPQLAKLGSRLAEKLPLRIANAPGDGKLNLGCGAEHCQKAREPPSLSSCPLRI